MNDILIEALMYIEKTYNPFHYFEEEAKNNVDNLIKKWEGNEVGLLHNIDFGLRLFHREKTWQRATGSRRPHLSKKSTITTFMGGDVITRNEMLISENPFLFIQKYLSNKQHT